MPGPWGRKKKGKKKRQQFGTLLIWICAAERLRSLTCRLFDSKHQATLRSVTAVTPKKTPLGAFQNLRLFQHWCISIASMYGIYIYTYTFTIKINQNVGEYTIPMDGMGYIYFHLGIPQRGLPRTTTTGICTTKAGASAWMSAAGMISTVDGNQKSGKLTS